MLFISQFFLQRRHSKIDESDNDDDSRNGRKVYNLTDILSTPSSGFYNKYTPQQRQQQQQTYEQLYYKPSTSADEKAKTKDRYYIYSHVKSAVDDDDVEDVNHDGDKSRKIRSSTLSDRKQVSRNISMVLENLLMSYENSQLPTHGEGDGKNSWWLKWSNIKDINFDHFFLHRQQSLPFQFNSSLVTNDVFIAFFFTRIFRFLHSNAKRFIKCECFWNEKFMSGMEISTKDATCWPPAFCLHP